MATAVCRPPAHTPPPAHTWGAMPSARASSRAQCSSARTSILRRLKWGGGVWVGEAVQLAACWGNTLFRSTHPATHRGLTCTAPGWQALAGTPAPPAHAPAP